jgi:hypothetical protein
MPFLPTDYRIQMHCLEDECDFYVWIVKSKLSLELPEIWATEWNFDCPKHGAQCARPFQAQVKTVIMTYRGLTTTRASAS